MLVRYRSRCSYLLLVAVLAAGTIGAAHAQDTPSRRQVAEFDRLYAWLDADATLLDLERWRRETARLKTLVPPGDVTRSLQHKSLACASDYDDVQAGFAFATRAVAEARAAGDRVAEVRLLYCQSSYRELFETPQTALVGYETGLGIARSLNNTRLISEGLVLRGGVRSLLGDQGLALLDFLEAQKLYELDRRPRASEANLQNIAIAYRRMGEYDKAIEYLEESRARSLKDKNWNALVLDLLQLGFVHESLNQPDKALAMYRQAEQLAKRHTWRYDLGAAHLGIAGTLVLKRQYSDALRMLDQTRREFAALGDTSNIGMIELYYGQARAGMGQHALALSHFDNAARDFENTGNERYLAMLYPERAASLHATGRTQAAVDDYKRFIALREVLRRKHGDQRTLVLRYEFDAARRDLDNRRLAGEKALREQEVAALQDVRQWQGSAMVAGSLLVLVMALLLSRQLRRTRRLRALALTDELTRVANRRSIELFGDDAFAEARLNGTALTVLTIDIDRFKAVNDTYGHFAGDEVLIRVAQACQAALRQFDRLGRIGGEEFLVILPDTDLQTALPIAERLNQSTGMLAFDDIAPELRVTLSIGVAAIEADDTILGDMTHRADLALYRAKRRGRNRVEAHAYTEPSVQAAAPVHGLEPAVEMR